VNRFESIFSGPWVILLLRGILAFILGVFALVNQRAFLLVFYVWFGAYLIVEGILKLVNAWLQLRSGKPYSHSLSTGLVSLFAGIAMFLWPGLSAVVIVTLIATQAIYQGASDIWISLKGRRDFRALRFWLVLLGGFVQVLFGTLMVFQPIFGGMTLIAVVGAYGVVVGVILIIRAIEERRGGGPAPFAPA
jgi:uncharacterized membrane protein HdeD (DUF308 family)